MPYYLKARSFGVNTKKSADAGLPFRTWLSVTWRARWPPAQDWPEEIAFNAPPAAHRRPKAGGVPENTRKSRGRMSDVLIARRQRKKRLLTPHPFFSFHMALGMRRLARCKFASHLSRLGDLVLGFLLMEGF